MKIGLLGFGAIGREVLDYLKAAGADITVTGALVTDPAKHTGAACPIVADPAAFLAGGPELVIECASQQAFAALVPQLLAAGKHVVAGSVGALADPVVQAAVEAASRAGGGRLYIPAGALAGIDALAAAKPVGISTVRYTRRAPPATWANHEAARGMDLSTLTGPCEVFAGTAREAARRFPKNANVAAIIALAGIGFEKTEVRILADPAIATNVHVIDAEGRFGRLHTELSATRISATTTSSRVVAGSLARGVLHHTERIAV
ncbi:MAG: aspartate dehydrogenase [Burkholderiales bacterium]